MLRFLTFAALLVAVFARSHHSHKNHGHNNDHHNNNNHSHDNHGGHSTSCQKNYHFDYILFAIQWPETFCEQQQCIKHTDKWQIHGAWPENNDGSYPQNCCSDAPFDMKKMDAALVKRMVANWGTLKAHGSNEEFWKHEYEKHGTCSIESPKLKTQTDYFTHSLDLFEKSIKIEQWFAAAGIKPSMDKTYKMTDVHAAIQKGLGHTAQIQCANSRRHKHMVFSQINFCINKDTLQPQDCPAAAHDRGCKADEIAYLPTTA